MTFPLSEYLEKAKELGHSTEFITDTEIYINRLVTKNLPVVFSLPHLCLLAQVSIANTNEICTSSRYEYYKRFKLMKKSGGFRVIQTPQNELKFLQNWILKNILENIPSHASCKGFDKRTSIKRNAEVHLKSECLLKIDLLRFFDSINEKRIYGLFKSLGYQKNLCVYLAKICTIEQSDTFYSAFKKNEEKLKNYLLDKNEGLLPQGSPTSPKLTNLVLRSLDKRLTALSTKNEIKYSRYADDLTFSGNKETLLRLKKVIYKIIFDENLFVNFGKTKLISRGNSYLVTGLSVQNSKVQVIRKKKKEIEHHLHHCLKNGVIAHLRKSKINNRNFKDWLYGHICFIYSIEKDVGEGFFEKFNKIQWPL